MSICTKCDEYLPPDNDFVVCQGCCAKLHYLCAGVRESKWRTNTTEYKSAWRCSTCKTRSDPTIFEKKEGGKLEKTLDTILPGESVNALGNMIRKIIQEENQLLMARMNEFQTSVEFCSNQIDDFTKLVKNLIEENVVLTKKYNGLEDKYKQLEKETNSLKIISEENLQYNRNRNLIVSGIPDIKNENLVDIAIMLSNSIDVSVTAHDIQAIHRLSRNSEKANPIIIQFTNRLVRDKFLENCKSRRPTTTNIYKDLRPSPIYVNEHLTPYFKNLMNEAKKKTINNEKVYKFVWFKNSKLLVRKAENEPVIRVTSIKDL